MTGDEALRVGKRLGSETVLRLYAMVLRNERLKDGTPDELAYYEHLSKSVAAGIAEGKDYDIPTESPMG